VAGIVESSPARPTFIRLLARVREHMTAQVARDGKAFITKFAGIRPFSRVSPQMNDQRTRFLETHSTFIAHVTFILYKEEE
jgi:hypothetical protein